MLAQTMLLALAGSIPLTMAYTNNCKGSSESPKLSDCQAGLATIDTSATYSDQAQFSVGDCYIIYATNNAGSQPVSGQTIKNTVQTILDVCKPLHGSYGTNNCESCHVTVNYRALQ